MTDVIIEPNDFLAFDVFQTILDSRLVSFQMTSNNSKTDEHMLRGDRFLCSEQFENDIGGQSKLLEIARKLKAKAIFVVAENSKTFSVESQLGGKYVKLSLPTYSNDIPPQRNYGLQLLACLVSTKNGSIAGDEKSYHLLKIAERVAKADVTVFIHLYIFLAVINCSPFFKRDTYFECENSSFKRHKKRS